MRQLKFFCNTIPTFLYSAEQKRSLYAKGKQHPGLVHRSGSVQLLHAKHLARAPHHTTEIPCATHRDRYQTHQRIKLEKGSSIVRVPSLQDTLSHSNKHFTSKEQQSGKLRTLCKGHSQQKDHKVKKSLLINDKFSTCCYNYKDNSSFMSVPSVLQL